MGICFTGEYRTKQIWYGTTCSTESNLSVWVYYTWILIQIYSSGRIRPLVVRSWLDVNIASFTRIQIFSEKTFWLNIFCFIQCVFGDQLSNLLFLHQWSSDLFFMQNYIFLYELCYGAWYYSFITSDDAVMFSHCSFEKKYDIFSICR